MSGMDAAEPTNQTYMNLRSKAATRYVGNDGRRQTARTLRVMTGDSGADVNGSVRERVTLELFA